MNFKNKKTKHAKGFGLIEVMVTILLLVVAVTGSMAYQYHAVLNARKADLYATASRISNLMLETWKGAGSLDSFAPETVLSGEMGISSTGSTGPSPILPDTLGKYMINENNANYYVTLSYEDNAATARFLNIAIAWKQRDYSQATFAETDNSINWTTCQGY
jgi:prepilin-type N-terminal cleavage/methylation domain-containing protein